MGRVLTTSRPSSIQAPTPPPASVAGGFSLLPCNPLDPFLQQRIVQLTFGPPDIQTIETQNNPALELSQFLPHLGQQRPVLEADIGGDQTRDQPDTGHNQRQEPLIHCSRSRSSIRSSCAQSCSARHRPAMSGWPARICRSISAISWRHRSISRSSLDSLATDFIEAASIAFQRRRLSCEFLPPADNHIAIR